MAGAGIFLFCTTSREALEHTTTSYWMGKVCSIPQVWASPLTASSVKVKNANSCTSNLHLPVTCAVQAHRKYNYVIQCSKISTTNSKEHSHFWQAKSSSVSHETLHTLWNPKVCCCVCLSLSWARLMLKPPSPFTSGLWYWSPTCVQVLQASMALNQNMLCHS